MHATTSYSTHIMMLHAAKKSTTSSALRWGSKSSTTIGLDATAAARRTFFTPKISGKKNVTFSSSSFAAGNNHQLIRMSSTLINNNINNYYYYDCSGIASSAIAGGGPGRSNVGNPSTMAFLGLRAKSSGAAFRHHVEDEEDVMMYDAATGSASGGRSNYQEWMVNLGRGDDEWLSKPRSGEWFTGLEPSICPGELLLILVRAIILYIYLCMYQYI